ncbi:MAG: hypothetical protein K6G42_00460 [Lachnospiraceae bacterium]|nr:hypothetical protein [Lachnospiraceae bacterium]
MNVRKDGADRRSCIAYILFAVAAVTLIIRAFYGFCQSDESFYISTAGRFAAGDLIFADEWHPTQLASLITMPFYKLYTMITGGTYGIILYFRILYVVFTTIEAVIVYRILYTKRGMIPSMLVSLFLMFYCHLNIPTLSYYTMSFHFFVLGFFIVYKGLQSSESAPETEAGGEGEGDRVTDGIRTRGLLYFILGGAVFALSVLCLPSLAIAYIIAMIMLLVCSIPAATLRKPLAGFTIGVLIPLTAFVIYIYASGNSIAGLLANLPYIMSDSEHDRGYVESFKVFFRAISDEFGGIYYLSIVLVILALLTYVNSELKRHSETFLLLIDVMLFVYYTVLGCRHTGFMNTAFALFVFPIFFMTKKKDWFIFLTLFIGGLAFSMTYSVSSFCDLYVLSIGHGIAATGGMLLLWDHAVEKSTETAAGVYKGTFVCVVAVFMIVTIILRFAYVYRDDSLTRLDSRITAGPAAGLITSKEHMEVYDSVLETISKYTGPYREEDSTGGSILFSKLLPWGYTASGMRVAAPDTWRNMISSERLSEYYQNHEYPNIVVVLDAYVGSYETSGDVEADPAPNQNELEGGLSGLLGSDYERYTEKDCTVYLLRKEQD